MSLAREFTGRLATAGEFLEYLWRRKLWWLIPLAVCLLLFGTLFVLGQSSSVAPLIYPLF